MKLHMTCISYILWPDPLLLCILVLLWCPVDILHGSSGLLWTLSQQIERMELEFQLKLAASCALVFQSFSEISTFIHSLPWLLQTTQKNKLIVLSFPQNLRMLVFPRWYIYESEICPLCILIVLPRYALWCPLESWNFTQFPQNSNSLSLQVQVSPIEQLINRTVETVNTLCC